MAIQIGIIGGSGLYDMAELTDREEKTFTTPFGDPSGPYIVGTLRVDDIYAALAQLKARGVRLIDEEPRQGAEGALVAFIHPASAHGVLVELKQATGGK